MANKGVKGTPMEYVRGIEKRHSMDVAARSCGEHCKLPEGHPLVGDGQVHGGGRGGSLPESNKSVSDRSGPHGAA